jgi:hypothetical protein
MIPRIWIIPSKRFKPQPSRRLCNAHLLLLSLIAGLFGTPTALASDLEASATGGYGRVGGENEDIAAQWAPLVGASFKFRLLAPEIKIDYEHLNWKERPANLHMIGVGWLIQFRSGQTRPFVQVGWTFGIERSHFEGLVKIQPGVPVPGNEPVFMSITTTDKFQGLAVSSGITRTVGKDFFIRPELRWRLIGPGPIMLTVPAVTLGYRF